MTQLTFIKSDFADFDVHKFSDIFDCPIARAAKRMFPNNKISVGGYHVRIDGIPRYFVGENIPGYATLVEYAEYYKTNEFAELLPKSVFINYNPKTDDQRKKKQVKAIF